MSAIHVNPPGSPPAYANLYSNATIVPAGGRLAFISSQWASDSNGNMIEGGEENYKLQGKQTWTNVMTILKGLGAGVKDIVHKRSCLTVFSDEIAKTVTEGALEAVGPEEAEHFFKSSSAYGGYGHFHRPDVLFMVDIIVLLPN